MIIGLIHKGSGLGDQLFSYIATRVRALDLGMPFTFIGKEFFKAKGFLNLDWGADHDMEYYIQEPAGKVVIPVNQGWDDKNYTACDFNRFELNKPYYDPEFNFIPKGSIIDGYGAQDSRYFEHRLPWIKKWLQTENPNLDQDLCIINVRGGEYRAVPELILPKSYWEKACYQVSPTHIQIHTDDVEYAKEIFGPEDIIRDISLNWRSLRYAKTAVISNSAFAIIPRLLKHFEDPEAITIAPKYWNRYNLKRWDWPGNYYKQFTYVE